MSDSLWCSRWRRYKSEIDRDAAWMKRNGGKYVKVTGTRGGPWRVRAKLPVTVLSKFVCWEANRESKMLDVPRVNSLERHQAGG